MHDSSKRIMKSFFDRYLDSNKIVKILDIGSQVVDGDIKNSYKYIIERENIKCDYIGVDMVKGQNVDIVLANPYDWKEIKSNSYDLVICGQVFEHVEFFWVTLMEIRRTLKIGGFCCIIAPSSGYEHKYPVDCYRFYPDGFKSLAEYVGLEVKECYAEWNNSEFPMMDIEWRDCVLIAKKSRMHIIDKIKFDVSNFFIKKFSLIKKIENKHIETPHVTPYMKDFEVRRNISLLINKKLYIDLGNGFNETDKIEPYEYIFADNTFILKYEILEEYRQVRFDPVEELGCIISDFLISTDDNIVNIKQHNSLYLEELGYIFNNTLDPQMIIDFENIKTKSLEIKGKIKIIL